jgi:hypothetical protein
MNILFWITNRETAATILDQCAALVLDHASTSAEWCVAETTPPTPTLSVQSLAVVVAIVLVIAFERISARRGTILYQGV